MYIVKSIIEPYHETFLISGYQVVNKKTDKVLCECQTEYAARKICKALNIRWDNA